MFTPGLPASASNTGAKSTTAFSSRSQKNETESFSTLVSRSDKHDTRSVSEELELAADKVEPDDEDAQEGRGRIDLRSSTSSATPKRSFTDLNAEFRDLQDALAGEQPAQVPSGRTGAAKQTETPVATAETGAAETGSVDENALPLPQKASGPSAQRQNSPFAQQALPASEPMTEPNAVSTSTGTKSDWTLPSKPEAGNSTAQDSDWTLPAKPAPVGQVKAQSGETVSAAPAQQIASGQESGWTLPSKPAPASAATEPSAQTLPAKQEAVVASTQISDWTLPAKVDAKSLSTPAGEAAAGKIPTGDVPVKSHAARADNEMPTASDAEVDDAVPAVDAPEASNAGGAIDVLSLLGGTASPVVAAVSAVAGRRGADETDERVTGIEMTESAGLSEGTVASDTLDMPSDESVVTGNDRTFRFASTREGATSMTMTIGTGDNGTARFDTARASASGAEGVLVLDSRRFLGFNQSANGASLTSAMVADPEWTSAMQPGASLSNAAAQSSTGNVVNTLKLQMTPIELGMVTATLRLSGDELTVHLTVENRAAHAQLTEDSSGIMDALKSQGFSVDQLTVSIAPMAQSDGTQQPATDLASRGQASDKQFDGSAGRGQEQGSSQSGGRNTSGRRENEPATDTGPAVAAGGARPQQLYI
jgi:chemotaxis protein MotD